MVACSGVPGAVRKGRIAVANPLVLGRRTSKRPSWLPSARWILAVLAVILAWGVGGHWVLLGLLLGDDDPIDGRPGAGRAGYADADPAAAGGESAIERKADEL